MQTSSSGISAGSSSQHSRTRSRYGGSRGNLNVNVSNDSSATNAAAAGPKWFPTTPVTPATPPDSASILIGAAGHAAHDRRNKTIMSCFRERAPSYMRSKQLQQQQQQQLLYQQQQQHLHLQQQQQQHLNAARKRPEAASNLRDSRAVSKSGYQKSASTRDLTRLMLEEAKVNNANNSNKIINNNNNNNKHRNNVNNRLRYAHHAANRSSSSSASSSIGAQRARVHIREREKTRSMQRIEQLEARVAQLEEQLQQERTFAQDLSARLQELSRRVEQLTYVKDAEKRKKSGSMRKKAFNGSSGGGSASTVQPTKFVAWMNLSNWFRHRPSIETLKEQNIYNDEPCFDTEIEMVLKHEVHKNIPKIVVDCCDLIEERYRRDTQPIEGIYRQCGDYNKIQGLRFAIDSNDYASLRQPNIDIHTLTGVLKLFLREIKSPLVSTNEAKTFIGKPNKWLLTDLAAKIEIMKRLIRSLPEVNRDTMEYLFAHFHKLTKVPLQQISAETLALSVTPSIFHTVQQGANTQDIHELLKETEILADCVKIMVEYHSRIFECTAERRQRRISVRRLRKTLSHPDLIFQNFF